MNGVQRVVDGRARLASIVLWGTVSCGIATIVVSLVALVHSTNWTDILPYVVLAVMADLLAVDLFETKRERHTLTLGIAVEMAAVAVNPWVAPLVGLADAVVHTLRSKKRRRLDKTLFNLTNVPLATGVASAVYLLV